MNLNKKYIEVSQKYEISQEDAETIINQLGIENPARKPSSDRVEAFTNICSSIKEGKSLEEAVNFCLANQEYSVEKITGSIGQQIGETMAKNIVPLTTKVYSQLFEQAERSLQKNIVYGFIKTVSEEEVLNGFQEYIDGQVETIDLEGKLLESHPSPNAILPPESLEL